MKHTADRDKLLAATKVLLATLAASAPEKELLQAGIAALMDLLQVRYGAISMLDEHGEPSQFVYAGLDADEAGKIMHGPTGAGLLGMVSRKNVVIRLDDIAADSRRAGFPAHHPHMTSLLAVPISSPERVFGRIYLCDKHDGSPFTAEDEELALNFASALSQSIDRERKLVELKKEQSLLAHTAFHDPLTNLPNRNLLGDRIGRVLSRAHRNNQQAAIMFCDLDDFKAVNDMLGHQAGDQVLKTMGERLKRCVREEDTVARIGGDEFVFVIANVESADHTRVVAQKILEVMSQSMYVDDCEVTLSGSIGISIYPFDGEGTERLMKNADAAMYKAKAGGKNNYCFFSEVATEMPEQGGVPAAVHKTGRRPGLHPVR